MTGGTQFTTSCTGFVERAAEASLFEVFSDIDWLEPNDGEINDTLLGLTVLDARSFEVPSGTLEEETVDVYSIFWGFCNFLAEDSGNVTLEGKSIDWNLRLSRIRLKGCSHETLWEEESWYPEGKWWSLMKPFGQEFDSLDQVWNP